jgi:hypothetical protein
VISGAYFLFVGYLLANEAVGGPSVAVPTANAKSASDLHHGRE